MRRTLLLALTATLLGCSAPTFDASDDDVEVAAMPSAPERLSEAGLYDERFELEQDVESFVPRWPLWSDGAEKVRYVRLPAGALIDTSDMDHWSFPVGTTLYKEFVQDGLKIETRTSHRFGPGEDDWWFASYAWNDDESDALIVHDDVSDARGTSADIPGEDKCDTCHDGNRILGFSALQLTHDGEGLTLDGLGDRMTDPPEVEIEAPGSEQDAAVLGYLHANCGHCHDDDEHGVSFKTPFRMRLRVGERLEETGVLTTAVGQSVEGFIYPGVTERIAAGDPDASCVSTRMSLRDEVNKMPWLGTEIVDEAALTMIRSWIASLPQQ